MTLSQRFITALSDQNGTEGQQEQHASRRRVLLAKLLRETGGHDGLEWVAVHNLMGLLKVKGGMRQVFWEDLDWLHGRSLIQLRWAVHPWPAEQASKGLNINVVRLREALLRHPRLMRSGGFEPVAQAVVLDVEPKRSREKLRRLIGRTKTVDLLVSPTRGAVHLLAPGAGRAA